MNKTVKNTIFYSLGNILPKITSFLLLPLYTYYLSTDEFGLVNSMLALIPLFSVLFSLALERSIFRLYFDYDTLNKKKEFLGAVNSSILISSSLFLVLVLCFHYYIAMIFKSIDFFPYFFVTFLIIFSNSFFLTPKIYLQVTEQGGKFFLISFAQFFFSILFVLFFLIIANYGAIGVLYGRLVGSLLIIPFIVYFSIRNFKINLKLKYIKNALQYSSPLIISLIAAWVLNLSDRIFIERYFSLHEVGIYSLGYTIASMSLFGLSALSMSINPIFFKLANSKAETNSNKIQTLDHTFLNASIILCFIPAFYSKDIMYFLDSKFSDAFIFIPLISSAYMFIGFQSYIGRYIKQSKKTFQSMIISLFIAGLNIGLNFILIPNYGAIGAAISTIICFSSGFFISYFYARKYCFFIKINWSKIIPLLFMLIILVIISIYILNISIIYSIVLKTVVLIIISILFYRINLKNFLKIVK